MYRIETHTKRQTSRLPAYRYVYVLHFLTPPIVGSVDCPRLIEDYRRVVNDVSQGRQRRKASVVGALSGVAVDGSQARGWAQAVC